MFSNANTLQLKIRKNVFIIVCEKKYYCHYFENRGSLKIMVKAYFFKNAICTSGTLIFFLLKFQQAKF